MSLWKKQAKKLYNLTQAKLISITRRLSHSINTRLSLNLVSPWVQTNSILAFREHWTLISQWQAQCKIFQRKVMDHGHLIHNVPALSPQRSKTCNCTKQIQAKRIHGILTDPAVWLKQKIAPWRATSHPFRRWATSSKWQMHPLAALSQPICCAKVCKGDKSRWIIWLQMQHQGMVKI